MKLTRIVLPIALFAAVTAFFFKDLVLLRSSDPPKKLVFQYSFHDRVLKHSDHILATEGFVARGKGLELPPGGSGKILFSFDKAPGDGFLLRIWLYGSRLCPNSIQFSADAGKTFHTVAANGNSIGRVFDISDGTLSSDGVLLVCEAKNSTALPAVVLDQIEVIVGNGNAVRPALPYVPAILAAYLLVVFFPAYLLRKAFGLKQLLPGAALIAVMVVAAHVRWAALSESAGTLLDFDARWYYAYAQQMHLFGQKGFFSAQFGTREPLFLLTGKIFLSIFGATETHLRFVSFTFSLLCIWLTFLVGRGYCNTATGLCASALLALHPYLIDLSARGLREEFFTFLLLLLLYLGNIKKQIPPGFRVMLTGVTFGGLLLTRSEYLPVLLLLICSYPFCDTSRWNMKRALASCSIGLCLIAPHLYTTCKIHGNPFHAAYQHTRFYANREFAGTPGFPSHEDIAAKGMYTGPPISPFAYYFKLHAPFEILKRSAVGWTKINLQMPLAFASGKGSRITVESSIAKLRKNFSIATLMGSLHLFLQLYKEHAPAYTAAAGVLLLCAAGPGLMILHRRWLLLIYVIAAQAPLSFLAGSGIDTRLTVASYPLMAVCCGYGLYCLFSCMKR